VFNYVNYVFMLKAKKMRRAAGATPDANGRVRTFPDAKMRAAGDALSNMV
jgi:hypothetical protein